MVDIYAELKSYNTNVDIFDPWANKKEVLSEYGIDLIESSGEKKYDAVILAVAHKEFQNINFEKLHSNSTVVYDTKAFIKKELIDGRL